ncbi:MAG: sugar nucleotide-binding protein [Pseudomonadota bacterium]
MNAQGRPDVLVIGQTGQLARALALVGTADCTISFIGRPEVDLERPESVLRALSLRRPDVVINAAGLTDGRLADAAPARALAVNATGAGNLAEAAANIGAAVIQISTADVFDGRAAGACTESTTLAAIDTLGASKLLGEELVLLRAPRSVILRAGWMFSPWDCGAVLSEGHRLVSPCSALDLARICLWLAPTLAHAGPEAPYWGVTHCANGGVAREQDLVASLARAGIQPNAYVGAPAAREATRSVATLLDCKRLAQIFGHRMPHWEESLREVLSVAVRTREAVPA